MKETFADLGIPFPLFEGPVEDAADYAGPGACSICGKQKPHCFNLGIGCDLMIRCEKCGTIAGLDADDRANGPCPHCHNTLKFPQLTGEIKTCYQCLRLGRAAITKDTQLGMVTWENATPGITHALPREGIQELLRTPNYLTIQGESWQLCCNTPMIFLGSWTRAEFSRRAPDGNGRAYFHRIVQEPVPGLWEDNLHDQTGIYVFRCAKCSTLRAHWDIA